LGAGGRGFESPLPDRRPVRLTERMSGWFNQMFPFSLRDRNWDDVLAEMAKCDVVCANCHRRRTARRGGFLRAAVAQR
jgi:hypothetical protein